LQKYMYSQIHIYVEKICPHNEPKHVSRQLVSKRCEIQSS
jgi:hypothetical protein